jgi:Nif-specific regulatory protein
MKEFTDRGSQPPEEGAGRQGGSCIRDGGYTGYHENSEAKHECSISPHSHNAMIHSISLSDLCESGLASIQKELKIVQLLFDVSQVLNKSLNLEESLQSVLEKMAEQAGMKEGTVTLINTETGEWDLHLAYGISKDDRPRWRIIEEITDRVVETGIPAIADKTFKKPRSFNGGHAPDQESGQWTKRDISCIYVPIRGADGIVGAIGSDQLFPDEESVEEDARLLAQIAHLLANAVEIRREVQKRQFLLQTRIDRLQNEITDNCKPASIIGSSHAIQKVRQLINQASSCRSNVLLTGEDGTGKELIARAIHANSSRAEKPFIHVPLAALSQSMISSELFGTSPDKIMSTGPKGCFEIAKGGTLFLDEISCLPMTVQTGILRVLQQGEMLPGADPDPGTDVRIISSSRHTLNPSVQSPDFRPDLFYRLNAFPIFVPPLRERKTDIMLLTDHFIARTAKKHSKLMDRISAHSIDLLMRHSWPGNVRELEDCIEAAVLLSTDGVIHAHHLPPSVQVFEPGSTSLQGTLQGWLAVLEQDLIVDALRSARGNTAQAARFLGINKLLLRRRIKKYGLTSKHFKSGD